MSRNTTSPGPQPSDGHSFREQPAGTATGVSDFAQAHPSQTSPISQPAGQQHGGAFTDDTSASQHGSPVTGDGTTGRFRSTSNASTAVQAQAPSRSNTLKKKSSVRRTGSLKYSASKRGVEAGSVRAHGAAEQDYNSVFHTPVPTQGSPTEVLANRFQGWRQLLKSLITYFREVQNAYDTRSKAVHKVQSTLASISQAPVFTSGSGLSEATRILNDYHKRSINEANKSRDIEIDVIGALTGLRNDLGQKIKEIKGLSGDFKNSVEKEKDSTRREVERLQEALQHVNHEDGSATGRNDPFVVKLGVDRSVERQIDEENYLHRAYLNLESSGRELESIVVGEIQKAYNALASILKREGDDALNVVESLRSGPIAMPKDHEWTSFVTHDQHFVDPSLPLRRLEDIHYPGKNNPAAAEIRAGMLERKSKYLKSYTPGWYVLSPTHLHEFKSADKIYTQPPVMSLFLMDQKLGSKSEAGSSSHKFMLKGKQSGGMHKGHNWVFRAETHDTMLAWYDDIHSLTEKTGAERQAFVRKHARSVSGMSDRATVSSDGFEEDEADAVPYAADAASLAEQQPREEKPQRPQPGGRFPSNVQVPQAVPTSPTSPSEESSDPDRDIIAAATIMPGSGQQAYQNSHEDPYRLDGVASGTRATSGEHAGAVALNEEPHDATRSQQPVETYQPTHANNEPVQTQTYALPMQQQQPVNQQQPSVGQQQVQSSQSQPQQQTHASQPLQPSHASQPQQQQQQPSTGLAATDAQGSVARQDDDWLAPAAAGVAGVGAGALGAEAYRRHKQDEDVSEQAPEVPAKSEARDLPNDREAETDALERVQTSELPPESLKGMTSAFAGPVAPSSPPEATNIAAFSTNEARAAEPAHASVQEQESVPEPEPQSSSRGGYVIGGGAAGEYTATGAFMAPQASPATTEPAKEGLGLTSLPPTAATTTTEESSGGISGAYLTSLPPRTSSRGNPAGLSSSSTGGAGLLGGLESEGARETGGFPTVVRHNTDMSISHLHVPGEFPKRS